MKFKKSVSIVFTIIGLTGFVTISPNQALAGNEGAHGGDPLSQAFVESGYAAEAILESWAPSEFPQIDNLALTQAIVSTYVKTEKRVFVIGPDGKWVERAAKNEPNATSPTITVSQMWPKEHPMTSNERTALALHEYLGIMKVEVDVNSLSSRFLAMLDSSQDLNGAAPTGPEVLYDQPLGHDGGVSLQDAKKECEVLKPNYRERYGIVYCVYYQRNRYSALEMSQPIFGLRLLGLQLVGVPPVESLSPKDLVFSSERGADGIDPISFDTDISAQAACRTHIVVYASNGALDWRYRGAQCRIYARAGRLYYDIVNGRF